MRSFTMVAVYLWFALLPKNTLWEVEYVFGSTNHNLKSSFYLYQLSLISTSIDVLAPEYLFSYILFTSESLLSKVLGGASFPSTREYSSGLSALSPPPPLLAELEPDFLELKHVSITLCLVTWATTQWNLHSGADVFEGMINQLVVGGRAG